jgi:plasmid stabilization system protein ParE
MKVEYAKKSLADLREILSYYATNESPALAAKVAARIQEVVARIARAPESGRPVMPRPGVRVVPLLHYRYNIFYFHTVSGETVRILHIRHTSRRPWTGGPR